MFQEIEQVGMRTNVEGFSAGGGGQLRLLLDGDEVTPQAVAPGPAPGATVTRR